MLCCRVHNSSSARASFGRHASTFSSCKAAARGRFVDVTVQPPPHERIPVTILTGFLGAGKTTLLNHILKANHGRRLAVIQNEFGEVGIDDVLTAASTGSSDLFTMNNGCLCCTVRGDIAPTMEDLWLQQEENGALDGVIVEATGLAMPGPVVGTFLSDSPAWISRVDAVVCVFDAINGPAHLQRARETGEANEVVEQVASADVLLVNKCDAVVSSEELDAVEQELREINQHAKMLRSSHSNVCLDDVLGINAFDLDCIEEKLKRKGSEHNHSHGHSHGEHSHGHPHGGHSHGLSHGGHSHGVSSVSLTHEGPMDYYALNNFIGALLANNGENSNVYRCKGIVATCTSPSENRAAPHQKLVFQGVQDHFQGEVIGEFEVDEALENRMVFIGKGLDHEFIRDEFDKCKR